MLVGTGRACSVGVSIPQYAICPKLNSPNDDLTALLLGALLAHVFRWSVTLDTLVSEGFIILSSEQLFERSWWREVVLKRNHGVRGKKRRENVREGPGFKSRRSCRIVELRRKESTVRSGNRTRTLEVESQALSPPVLRDLERESGRCVPNKGYFGPYVKGCLSRDSRVLDARADAEEPAEQSRVDD